MPEWIHNRAEHLLAKNPDMSKSKAFAIATQQSHALGKSPKGYGTAEGKREAKAKYDTPKGDVKKANPGSLESPKMAEVNVKRLVSRYKDLPEEKLKQIAERIGRAKEKLHGTKIYPLEGKLSPGGSLDMAGGETYRKGKAALEAAQSKYTDLSKARHGAAQALFERNVTASVKAPKLKIGKDAAPAMEEVVGGIRKSVGEGAEKLKELREKFKKLKKEGSANVVGMAAMRDEFMKIALAQLEKDAGVKEWVQKVKDVALTDVGGPKLLLNPRSPVAGAASTAARTAAKAAPKAAPKAMGRHYPIAWKGYGPAVAGAAG